LDLQKFLLVAKDLNVFIQYFYLIKVGFSCTHDTKHGNPCEIQKPFFWEKFYSTAANIWTSQQ